MFYGEDNKILHFRQGLAVTEAKRLELTGLIQNRKKNL